MAPDFVRVHGNGGRLNIVVPGLGEPAHSPLCEAAHINGVRLRDLRHHVATRLLTDGVGVRTVPGRLGHRNAATAG